ncbi:MAG: IS1634 family transposase [Anaerovoracaceae bacterium]
MKLTVSKSKNSASFYVQKTIRKPNGSVTTVTIEKLGNLTEVTTKAGGKDPYIWAQDYVNELNRKEYDENKEIIVSYSPSKLLRKDEEYSFNCGYLFLQKIYYSLGLDQICKDISSRHSYSYDLNDILSKLIFTRILYPSSKLSSYRLAQNFVEQPTFELHDVYQALSVLAEENDFIQSQLYKNSQKGLERQKDILYYDCTNYFFELEEADDLRQYGKSKQHQPLPIVGMGLFMDYDGIPLAFDIYPGNQNEQPTLKPLEKKVISDYGPEQVVICTDAGLSSKTNRKFNDQSLDGIQIRSFITTQSVKQLPEYLREFALDPDGWKLKGSNHLYNLNEIDEDADYNKIFYKDRWIKEDLSQRKIKNGAKPLEQHLIISFSPKYKNYQQKIRNEQIERAQQLINSRKYKQHPKNQNDPHRFIAREHATEDGEICSKEVVYLDINAIQVEEQYDGFYAVCTNLNDMSVEDVVHINKKRWEIEECFRIMKTDFKARPVYLQTKDHIKAHFITCFIALVLCRILEKKLGEEYTCEKIIATIRNMSLSRPSNKMGYIPVYTRTDLTDALHETAGFRTDYEIISDVNMRKTLRESKKKK